MYLNYMLQKQERAIHFLAKCKHQIRFSKKFDETVNQKQAPAAVAMVTLKSKRQKGHSSLGLFLI